MANNHLMKLGIARLLTLACLLGFLALSQEASAQRNLRSTKTQADSDDPFVGKWKWHNGGIRVATKDHKFYLEEDPNWSGKWEKIEGTEKYRFTFGPRENPLMWVVIGTVNEDGTTFEGISQEYAPEKNNKDFALKLSN